MKIKFYLLFVPALLIADYGSAQTITDTSYTAVTSDTSAVIDMTLPRRNESDSTDKWPMVVPDVLPSFKGGDFNKFRRWVQLNVDYPLEAAKVGLQGTVVISFVIERDGSVTNVQVVRSVHPELDKAAMRVVSRARGWEPALIKGEPQRVRYSIPIIFGLQ
jgi:TonB family protein